MLELDNDDEALAIFGTQTTYTPLTSYLQYMYKVLILRVYSSVYYMYVRHFF